ncbi:hypothetical protein M8C21_018588, partial [Ambrosia artemisiifolia]
MIVMKAIDKPFLWMLMMQYWKSKIERHGGKVAFYISMVGRPQIAWRAIEVAELRLAKDGWPEYYGGKSGWYIEKQARKHQTWSVAGYLVAKMMLEDPSHL